MLRPLFATILGLSLSVCAQESSPGQVDLRHQFGPPRQQEGGTCHVYAAVALLEAACYRVLGKHLDISEAYLSYRHLRDHRTQFQGGKLAPGGVHYWVNENPSAASPSVDELGPLEAGDPRVTLERALNEGACLESEMKEDPLEFFLFLERAYKTSRNAPSGGPGVAPFLLGGVGASLGGSIGAIGGFPFLVLDCNRRLAKLVLPLSSFAGGAAGAFGGYALGLNAQGQTNCQEVYCKRIDTHVQKVAAPQFQNEGLIKETEDPDLKKCLETVKVRTPYRTTHKNMKALLREGMPFLIGGRWNYYSKDKKGEYTRRRHGQHAAVVIGYKDHSAAKSGTYYLIRNSWGDPPEWVEIDEESVQMEVVW